MALAFGYINPLPPRVHPRTLTTHLAKKADHNLIDIRALSGRYVSTIQN